MCLASYIKENMVRNKVFSNCTVKFDNTEMLVSLDNGRAIITNIQDIISKGYSIMNLLTSKVCNVRTNERKTVIYINGGTYEGFK